MEREEYEIYNRVMVYLEDIKRLRDNAQRIKDYDEIERRKKELLDFWKKNVAAKEFDLDAETYLKEYPDLLKKLHSETEAIQNNPYVFKKAGPGWIIVFDGKAMGPFKGKGFAYLHYCIEKCPEEFTNIELDEGVNASGKARVVGRQQDKVDHRAIKEAKNRYKELMEELAEAEDNRDLGRIDKLQSEKGKIEDYLSQCERMGKLKSFRSDETRISDKVNRAISRDIEKLVRSEEAYKHFREAFKPIFSSTHQYKPTKKLDWVLD